MHNMTDMIDKVHCADCLEFMRDMPDNCVDLVLTDPPYFLPAQSYVGARGKGYPKRTLADTSPLKAYFHLICGELDRITKPDGTWYLFCDGQSYPIFYEAMFPHCKHVRPLIWDKMVSYNGYTWRHGHELIAWGERAETKRVPTGDSDILRCRGVKQKDRLHPAEKPVELHQKLIRKHEPGIVLDSFAGSGSVQGACVREARHFVGIEISPEYCDIAEKRIQEERDKYKMLEGIECTT